MESLRARTPRRQSGALFTALLTAAACVIYGVSAGVRSNYGVMLGAISESAGISYASVSFVLALGQLMFGVMQPVFGIVALKRSNRFVLICGSLMMAAGLLAIPFCKTPWLLVLFLGVLLPGGTGAMSFGIIMSAVSLRLPEDRVPAVSGLVSASPGVGNSVLSPVLQGLIAASGLLGAMVFLSIPALLLLPVSVWLCRERGPSLQESPAADAAESGGVKALFLDAFQNRTYRCIMAGFFTCGFHMAIIETHLYTQLTTYGIRENIVAYAFSAYGVATIVGSISSGAMCARVRMKQVLWFLYGFRAVFTLCFLLAPKTVATAYAFTILLGLTGSATVAPTSGLVGRTFGPAKLATLFGFAFFCHQVGSFLSAGLGGLSVSVTGSYVPLWCVDAALCLFASTVSFLIREEKPRRR